MPTTPAFPTNAGRARLRFYWWGQDGGGSGKKTTFRPTATDLTDMSAFGYIETDSKIVLPDEVTALVYADLICTDDPDLTPFLWEVTREGQTPKLVEVSVNAPVVDVGGGVMMPAVWLTDAATADPPRDTPDTFYNSTQTDAAVVTGVEVHNEDTTAHPDIRALAQSGSVADATTSVKGKARLLGGTADNPTVPYSAVTGAPTVLPPSGGAGGVLGGTFPNPSFAVDMATQAELDAAAAAVPEQARDAVGAALVPGSNVTITVDDTANTITIAATATGPSYTDEQVQDVVAALLAAGSQSGITFTYDDAGNALSATVSAQTWTQVTGKPTFSTVATSGSYDDLVDLPTGGDLFAGVAVPNLPPAVDLTGRATYYVDSTSGSDSNAGTSPSTPKATLAGLPTVAAGDVVALRCGSVFREPILFPTAGTVGHPIVYGQYGTGPLPKIKGSKLYTGLAWTVASGSIYQATATGLSSAWNAVYVDETIRLTKQTSSSLTAPGQAYVDVAGNTIYVWMPDSTDPTGRAIEVPGGISGLNNSRSYITVQDIAVMHGTGNFFGHYSGNAGVPSTNVVVQRCQIGPTAGPNGIWFAASGTIQDNYVVSCFDGLEYPATGGTISRGIALLVAGGTEVRRNRVTDCFYGISVQSAANHLIHHNTVWLNRVNGIDNIGGANPVYIYNNTVWHRPSAAAGHGIDQQSSGDGARIKNNIVYCDYTATPDNVQLYCLASGTGANTQEDYNLGYRTLDCTVDYGKVGSTTTYPTAEAYWAATRTSYGAGNNTHSLTEADPKFWDLTTSDLHLLSTSPARQAGLVVPGVTDGFLGTSPDLGAQTDDYPNALAAGIANLDARVDRLDVPGITIAQASSGGSAPSGAGEIGATIQGFIAWPYDVILAGTPTVVGTGCFYSVRMACATAGTVDNLHLVTTAVAGGAVAGGVAMGIYDSSGVRLGVTGDIGPGLVASAGFKSFPLAASVTVTAGQVIYVGLVWNGTTGPSVCRGGGAIAAIQAGVNTVAANQRFGQLNSQATLPTSISPSALSSTNASWWFGAS